MFLSLLIFQVLPICQLITLMELQQSLSGLLLMTELPGPLLLLLSFQQHLVTILTKSEISLL